MTQDEIRDNVHQVLTELALAFGEHMPSLPGFPGITYMDSDWVSARINWLADGIADVAANGTSGETYKLLVAKASDLAQRDSVQDAMHEAMKPQDCFGPNASLRERLAVLEKTYPEFDEDVD